MAGNAVSNSQGHLSFMMIVNDPQIARFAIGAGVDMLFVDLESLGKAGRQGHVDSWKSSHTFDDLSAVRKAVPDAELLARVNPMNEDSRREIDDVVSRGADKIMLPMFRTMEEVVRFEELVAGRARPVLLFETFASLALAERIANETGIRHAHIGLNDLHLDMGQDFMFEPLSDGVLEKPCASFREAGIQFGIGGLARAGEGIVSPEYLIGEHVRLGSTAAILSRTFHRGAQTVADIKETMDFEGEVAALRSIYQEFVMASPEALARNRVATADKVRDVVRLIASRRQGKDSA